MLSYPIIRNPLSDVSSLAEEEAPGIEAKVKEQIRHIDEMVKNLDIRWNESEKVLRFLRLHYQIGHYTGNRPPNDPGA